MRKTREILRLKWQQGRSHRQIVAALAVGLATPSEVVGRARRAGITSWAEVYTRRHGGVMTTTA